ncbi:MAG: hypothetical protein ACPHER_08360 [Nevskiales bacterium]
MFSYRPGQFNRVLTFIGFIVGSYGGYLWMQLEPAPEGAHLEMRIEEAYKQEMWRMQQVQVRRLAEAKDQLSGMTPEQQALLLHQASEPIQVSPEREALHKKAIRRDITSNYESRRKRAVSMLFLGGALLFITLTPQLVQRWLTRRQNTQ